MADKSDINAVETEDDYIHVQFQDPDQFEEIRTPDWAANAAQSVSDGAEVRTGKHENSNDWEVETVLIKKVSEKTKRKTKRWRSSRKSNRKRSAREYLFYSIE